MFSWIFIFWLLQTHVLVCTFDDSQCSWETKWNRYSDGNVVIAAFVPLSIYNIYNRTIDFHVKNPYFRQFKLQNYQCSLSFIFAIEEINRNPHLLPNTSLGFDLYDVQRSEWGILTEAFFWLTGIGIGIPNYRCRRESKAVALLTGASWLTSARIGRLLNLYKYPQLSFGPFNTLLNDRGQFPYVYQTAPKDSSLSLGIISLLLHFSWTWVGLVLIDNHKGSKILSDMRGEMYRNRVCIAFVKMAPENLFFYDTSFMETINVIEKSSANVVIIYDDRESLHCLIMRSLHFVKTWKVWVMNAKFDSSICFEPFIFDSFHGTLLFTHHHDEISDFRTFIQAYTPSKYPDDHYLDIFWKNWFNCSLSLPDCKVSANCQPNVSLELLPSNLWEMSMTEASYNIYNSVYAVAQTLHKMTVKQVEIEPHGNGERNIYPWELHPFLKKIQLKNGAGHHVVLDSQMKLDEEYDILNFWNFPNGLRQNMKVGTFSSKAPHVHQLFLSDHMIQWATGFTELPRSTCSESCVPGFRKLHLEVEPNCCYDCAPCPENEISNETDMDNCVKCPESHYANAQQNHCLEKAVTFLSYEDPLGKALSCMSLGCSLLTAGILGVFVKHYHTPIVKANNRSLTCILLITLNFCFLCPLFFIGHPNTAICVLQQSIFAVLFTVALSTVLAKTLTVVLAFKATVPGRMVRWLMTSRASNFIIPFCTLTQLVLCGIWLSISPPFVDLDAHSEHGHIIIVCNKGSELAFHCVLGYLCCLALGSYTMAYLSMNLPDTFNEAKFLTFSMLMFFCVWVTFLPVYHNTKGKVMVAMEVFAILSSSAGLLGCIFAPKCYIILLRPERNSLHFMKSKAHSRIKF